mmetsp:Transcript_7809/g.13096  ORF Transcript_7809/g.13096 Transcript_7809/m.13096 type:complete len:141 (-) Transcript_7809:495-917(-)
MNEYYKHFHQKLSETKEERLKNAQKNLSSVTKADMDENIERFLRKQVSGELFRSKEINDGWRQQIIISMMVFLFSHRHTKVDQFIVETRERVNSLAKEFPFMHMDFTVVRDVMYKYSKKAQERFFSFPIETYFFVKFAQS